MLRNGRYEFLSRVYLDIFLVFAWRHLWLINDGIGLFIICQIFKREGIADDMLWYGFLSLFIVSGNTWTIVHTEAGMSPTHKFVDWIIIYFKNFRFQSKCSCNTVTLTLAAWKLVWIAVYPGKIERYQFHQLLFLFKRVFVWHQTVIIHPFVALKDAMNFILEFYMSLFYFYLYLYLYLYHK